LESLESKRLLSVLLYFKELWLTLVPIRTFGRDSLGGQLGLGGEITNTVWRKELAIVKWPSSNHIFRLLEHHPRLLLP